MLPTCKVVNVNYTRAQRAGREKEMANIYYQEDCNLSLLEGKTIAVIGYGSQGHAHALNAKESGCHVIIGLYEGSKSWARAEAQGFERSEEHTSELQSPS